MHTPDRRRPRAGAALALICASVVWAGAQQPAVEPRSGAQPAAIALPTIAFEKFTLANGLDVILSEDHRLPMVAVNVWYHVGPAYEEPGRTGFAHLFEHMMFQGSKHVPGDSHFRLVEGAGGSSINGTTGFDRTNYFETLPSNQLELGLWLESDRMGYLLDRVDSANLANQQDVVRNERRQSVENRPYGIVREELIHQLFPRDHPYYANVIGSHADIQAAHLDDVKQFFKKYYAPGNASLAIVGDIDPAATRRLVEQYFGGLASGPPVPRPNAATPPITEERRAVVTDRVELPRVYMAWLTPPMFKPGDAEADIAAQALGGGRSSRLYKRLVYDTQIAQSVSASQSSAMLASMFIVEATARPGHTAEEIEAALEAEVERFRETGPDASEVEEARNQFETQTVQGLERLGGFGGVADRLSQYNHYLGDPGYLGRDLARYRAASPESVKAFAQQHLARSARVVVHGIPGPQQLAAPVLSAAAGGTEDRGAAGSDAAGGVVAGAGAAESPADGAESINPDQAWRQNAPKPGAVRPLKVPVARSFTLANGLTVLLNERPGLPVVSASLVVRTGSGANPIDKPGLANFTAAMLDEGTSTRSAPQIADEVAQLGGSLVTGSTMDGSTVSIGSLTRTFPAMVELMADVVRRPSFPADEVERQRASRLVQLVQQRENAASIAAAVSAAALYGRSHPYGYTELGTEASNRAVSAGDLRGFWSRNFVPNNAALVVSGPVTERDLRPLVERTFGDWARGTPDATAIGPAHTTDARLVIVDRPGAAQSQLWVALVGASRSTPEYESLRVMNETLGGLFTSRINLNLREEHGYTYGARSQFTFRRSEGPFVVATGVRTDVTAPALSEIMKELARMRDSRVTPAELTLAKDALVRSLPAAFETSGRVTATTADLFLYGLPLDYYVSLERRIGSISAEQVAAAARKYIVPSRAVAIVVGDRAKVAGELAALGLGPAETWSADGAPLDSAPIGR
ncbi:MAG: M16 family metallopeptidase [Vicinamibacterales bacterium]